MDAPWAAVDVIVPATALRWQSDDFPGWIEVVVVDSAGAEHRIVEKAPVLTSYPIMASSAFPFDLWLRAEMKAIDGDEVRVRLSYDVATLDGARELVVGSADVKWL
ncbi:MAG: hypothetical protein ACT4QG_21060 [Sporichthyaceae bacterium]